MQGIFHTYGQLRITNYPNTHVFASKTSCHSDVQLLCLGSSSWAFQSNLCIHNCWETRARQQWSALIFCTPKGKPQFQGTAYTHISRKFLIFFHCWSVKTYASITLWDTSVGMKRLFYEETVTQFSNTLKNNPSKKWLGRINPCFYLIHCI